MRWRRHDYRIPLDLPLHVYVERVQRLLMEALLGAAPPDRTSRTIYIVQLLVGGGKEHRQA